ncbi:hypothetical protein COCVIDRAFT_115490, partial [Bipolaris victoriae FI3]
HCPPHPRFSLLSQFLDTTPLLAAADAAVVYCLVYRRCKKLSFHISSGKMAERSKALASGASREICVGSNPTLVNISFCSS